jgi:hypothetical protein
MELVVIAILFLLVVGAGVTIFVMAGTRDNARATAEGDDSAVAAPFAGRDHTPAGDTAQHAGEQDAEGRTVTPNDAEDRGGTGEPISRQPSRSTEDGVGGRFKRDPIGGEAEGEPAAPVGEPPRPGRN